MRQVVWFVVFAFILVVASVAPATATGAGRAPMQVIEVWKSRHELTLRERDRILRRFEVALGVAPRAAKRMRGDLRTPVGRYYVSEKRPSSRFHRFVGISYPNVLDAERGYKDHLIDAGQWGEIFLANLRGRAPTWRTPLGGMVGIHGYGRRPEIKVDWTEGCIAVDNDEIEYLYERVSVGTPVVIHE